MYYWIKERHNPQTGIYYSPMGRMPAKEARRHENSKYGINYIHKYKTKAEYEKQIALLVAAGETVFG